MEVVSQIKQQQLSNFRGGGSEEHADHQPHAIRRSVIGLLSPQSVAGCQKLLVKKAEGINLQMTSAHKYCQGARGHGEELTTPHGHADHLGTPFPGM